MRTRRKVVIVLLGVALLLAAGLWLRRGAVDEGRGRGGADRRLAQLEALGYVSFSREAARRSGSNVVLNKRGKAYPGYNLYCSRTAPEAFLMDMNGEVVHRWSYPKASRSVWDHVAMLDNGDLMVVHRFKQLLRLDWDSNLIWRASVRAHHDISLVDGSYFYVLASEQRNHRGFRTEFDAIVRVGLDGRVLDKWSTFDHLQEMNQAFDRTWFLDVLLDNRDLMTRLRDWPFLRATLRKRPRKFDYFHANTVSPLPDTPLGRADRRFRAGNLLICLRNIDQIAVLDGRSKEILWTWGEGILEHPHHPTMLEDGTILVFDNGTRRGYSRVVEMEPLTGRIVWEYVADPPQSFYTETKGSAQRLANGNTLICDGDNGRAFEVTREGEIVWEWLNPVMKEKRRATVYRMTRLERSLVDPLLERLGARADVEATEVSKRD